MPEKQQRLLLPSQFDNPTPKDHVRYSTTRKLSKTHQTQKDKRLRSPCNHQRQNNQPLWVVISLQKTANLLPKPQLQSKMRLAVVSNRKQHERKRSGKRVRRNTLTA